MRYFKKEKYQMLSKISISQQQKIIGRYEKLIIEICHIMMWSAQYLLDSQEHPEELKRLSNLYFDYKTNHYNHCITDQTIASVNGQIALFLEKLTEEQKKHLEEFIETNNTIHFN